MRMRILYVNHVSYVSGAENSLQHLVKHLDRTVYEPFVLCPPFGPLIANLKAEGVVTFTSHMGKRPSQFARTVWLMIRIISDHAIDLIHANSIDAIQYSALPALLTGTPLVGHVRNIVSFRLHGRWPLRMATRLIAVSDATRRSLVEHGIPSTHINIIYNGIDADQFRPMPGQRVNARHMFHLPCDAPLVGSVGRLHPVKGYRDFLQAARYVLIEMPTAHFAIAGGEFEPSRKHRDDLLVFARQLGIADRVRFVGEIDQVETFLQSLDVFVLPSLQEPFARAILEAMGCACPIVATAVGGTPEAIEDGRHGLLIPPACPDAMASAIVRLLRDHEYATLLGRAARARVVSRFSITSNVEHTQALYRELAPI